MVTDSGPRYDALMVDSPLLAGEPRYRMSREQYDALVGTGTLDGARVELLYGTLVEMSPQNDPHAMTLEVLADIVMHALHGRARVRIQAPFAASDDSEPEPDLLVAPKGERTHPRSALWIVEVTDSTRHRDLVLKSSLYGQNGVPEYWVIDVRRREVHVHTGPRPDGTWQRIEVHDETVALPVPSFPDVVVRLSEVLPPKEAPGG